MGQVQVQPEGYGRPGYSAESLGAGLEGFTSVPYSNSKYPFFRPHPMGRYGAFLALMHTAYAFLAFSAFAEILRRSFLPVTAWVWITFSLATLHLLPGLMGLVARMDKDKRTRNTLGQHHAPFIHHALSTGMSKVLLTVGFFVFKYTHNNLERFDDGRFSDRFFINEEFHKYVQWNGLMLLTVAGFLISSLTGAITWETLKYPRQVVKDVMKQVNAVLVP